MPRFFNHRNSNPMSTVEYAKKTPEFHAILKLIESLNQKQVTINFAQNCIAASDIMQASLNSIGIKSRIVEVQYGDQCREEDIERRP